MYDYPQPTSFHELVEMLLTLEEFDFCECDDGGIDRLIEVGGMEEGLYVMYEDGGYIGCTDDVVTAAQFISQDTIW